VKVSKIFAKSLVLSMLVAVILTACGSTNASPSAYPNPGYPNPVTQEAATLVVRGDAASGGEVSFSKDILPIFESRCLKCHGGDKTEKGLDLKTYASMMLGSEKGPVITAGNSDGSSLYMSVFNGDMPKNGPKLTAEEIALIESWISSGAPDN
jgi:mono/diheme cytochrome c family protein